MWAFIPKKSYYRYGFGRIYGAIKHRFRVRTYRDISQKDYHRLRTFIMSLDSGVVSLWHDSGDDTMKVKNEALNLIADAEGLFMRAKHIINVSWPVSPGR